MCWKLPTRVKLYIPMLLLLCRKLPTHVTLLAMLLFVIMCRKLPTPFSYVTLSFCKEAKLSKEEGSVFPRCTTETYHQAQAVALVCCKPTEISPAVIPRKNYNLIVQTAQEVYTYLYKLTD